MRNKRKFTGRVILLVIAALLIASVDVREVQAKTKAKEDHYLHDVYISVDGGEERTIRAVDCNYRNNEYVSLKDMAELLRGTKAAFGVVVDNNEVIVTIGDSPDERSLSGWQDEEREAFTAKETASNKLSVNGEEKKYYSLRAAYEEEGVDCFLRPVNLCMLFDINISDEGENHFRIDTGSVMNVSPDRLEETGYFDDLNTLLVGDATDGVIYYEYKGDEPFAIASTTKLMTYLLVEEAVARGEFTEDDSVTVSVEAAEISASIDGVVDMEVGDQVTVKELIRGALLPSSNECALLLAEKVGGDKNTFVELMNSRASELGMSKTHFYNPTGLPDYNNCAVPAKRQNAMSAEDMFTLCSYILKEFPQIKEVTDQSIAAIPSLGTEVGSTNSLLYNMPEVNGLKTGTTDRAGACMVTSLTVNDGSRDHDLVVVLLGGENSKVRYTTSEMMAYYGKNVVLGKIAADGTSVPQGESGGQSQITISSLVNMVVKEAMRKGHQ